MIKMDWRKLPDLMESEREDSLGNKVLDLGNHQGDRYFFDTRVCTVAEGWKQYDTVQDAWYFGTWVHVEARQILCFAEGDLSLTVCPTQESFKAELAKMAEFYGDPPPAFTVIDTEEGTITKVYDERPTGV